MENAHSIFHKDYFSPPPVTTTRGSIPKLRVAMLLGGRMENEWRATLLTVSCIRFPLRKRNLDNLGITEMFNGTPTS